MWRLVQELSDNIRLTSKIIRITLSLLGIALHYVLEKRYSLRPIILFANIDVSRHILVVDTSILIKSNMGRREYKFFCVFSVVKSKIL
jgi:hypothetical protein